MTKGAQSSDANVHLSLVVPTFNEERRIESSLQQILSYLKKQPYSWEILVVDDGSRDRTRELVREFSSEEPGLSLIAEIHRGKGHAVKIGMQAAKGKYRFQCDADLSMPIEHLSRLVVPTFNP